MNHELFLQRCQKSSQDAYEVFKEHLAQIDNPTTRKSAISFGHSLAQFLMERFSTSEMLKQYHFAFSHLNFNQQTSPSIAQSSVHSTVHSTVQATALTLLQLPSTFAPEEWSFTFFEGLARYKTSEFQNRVLVELGCGIGWISLALAKQARPSKIYALDINPKAILCSKFNLALNGFDERGDPSWLHDGKTLMDIVEFHVSDLLEYCSSRNIGVDRIIGCIPQVLNPDPEFASQISGRRNHNHPGLQSGLDTNALDHANDDFLYSLSNYTPDQGYLEDQFGLGLIARSLEESVDLIKVSGKIILNLGGRPGSRVLSQLFLRRGFFVRPVWRTRVNQAKDTDIQSLISIEEKTDHRFEFYMGSDVPVCAKTAFAYVESGGEISHELTVYEAHLKDPVYLPAILKFIREKDYKSARDSIDLSYEDDSLIQEKTSFLSGLVHLLQQRSDPFPYSETVGLKEFRNHMSVFFQRYFKLAMKESSFLVLPSRVSLCENILHNYRPKIALVDTHLAKLLEKNPGILEIPRNSDLLCELIEKLRPEIVIYSMPPNEAETQDSLIRISETSERTGSRVLIDISELIELSSTPRSNGVFRYLSKNRLQPQLGLICGLVKNQLYRDLELCVLISQNKDFLSGVEFAAELTYSRTPVLTQMYYDTIFQELIGFQIETAKNEKIHFHPEPEVESDLFLKKFIPLSPETERAFAHPAIAGEYLARAEGLIRLDYGENCLSAPKALKRALLESFVKMKLTAEEADCSKEIWQLLQKRFRFNLRSLPRISPLILGCGVAPLFSRIAEYCAKSGYCLFFPTGAYGHFTASATYLRAQTITVPTERKNSFKLGPEHLEEAIRRSSKQAWVVLSAPLVNPTGAFYSAQEIHSLMRVIEKYSGVLVLDTVFSGLEFLRPGSAFQLPDFSLYPSLRWVVLGGLSKEFSAGGLRLGYAFTDDDEIELLYKHHPPLAPHSTLKFALKKVYQDLIREDSELMDELEIQRTELSRRARALTEVLRQTGWDPLPPEGGLFMSATPRDSRTIDLAFNYYREKVRVGINPPLWTGIPGYFRFVLSTSESDFEEALKRIQSKGNLSQISLESRF